MTRDPFSVRPIPPLPDPPAGYRLTDESYTDTEGRHIIRIRVFPKLWTRITRPGRTPRAMLSQPVHTSMTPVQVEALRRVTARRAINFVRLLDRGAS